MGRPECLLPRVLLGWCPGQAGADCQGRTLADCLGWREGRRGRCGVVPRPELWGIFPGSSWRRMRTPIEVTRLTARRWESIPDPVPDFPARDTDSDGRAGPLIVFTERLGGGSLLDGLVPRGGGTGAGGRGCGGSGSGGRILSTGLEAGGEEGQGRRRREGGVSSERSRGMGPLSQCLSGGCSQLARSAPHLRNVSAPPRSRTGARGGAGARCGGGC